MSLAHNTSISKVARWDWRLPPADRRDGEVRTYYLSPEELEKYWSKGERKVNLPESITTAQPKKDTAKKPLKEVLLKEYGRKSIEEIAKELGLRVAIVKAAAVRLGLVEGKQKDEKTTKIRSPKSSLKIKTYVLIGSYTYIVDGEEVVIKQDKRRKIRLKANEIDTLIEELKSLQNAREKVYRGGRGFSMNANALLAERNRLLTLYTRARGEDRTKILARLVVIDEELGAEEHEQRARSSRKAV